jgi:hypothetical protein
MDENVEFTDLELANLLAAVLKSQGGAVVVNESDFEFGDLEQDILIYQEGDGLIVSLGVSGEEV